MNVRIYIVVFVFYLNSGYCVRHYNLKYLESLREEVRQMFNHAYESYLKYAYPYDELRPLSCDGIDTWGSYSLTLIDALDTLAVMGNHTEFQRVVDILVKHADFDANNINVSVFETNIRIIGGLLSAHLLSYRAGVKVEQGWPCNGPLLELAENVAHKLIAAFNTNTGMPYGTVNLLHGVPKNETTVTCTAGVGTFILEFSTLSRLTGDPMYEEIAMNSLNALWNHRSSIGLVGNHIDIQTGRWTAHDAGIGAGVDSYFEYLAKGAIFLQKPDLMHMFNEYRKMIDKYLRTDDWYMWASMTKGQLSLLVFQSLEAYWPGVLSLIGDVKDGMKSLHNYHQVWKQYGFTPEFYNIPQSEAGAHRESYPLRPELIESVMYLYRATGDSYLLEVGEDILRSIQHSSITPCGYATIKDVRDHRKEDRMESFFLAETTKYLYLLFDVDNFIHNSGQHGTVINTPWGECIIDAGGFFFNTEAHPTDSGALHCCSGHLQEQIRDTLLDFDSLALRGEKLAEHRKQVEERKKKRKKSSVDAEDEAKKSSFYKGIKDINSASTEDAVKVIRISGSNAKDSQKKAGSNIETLQSVDGEGNLMDNPPRSGEDVLLENTEQKEKFISTKDDMVDYQADEDHSNRTDFFYGKTEVTEKDLAEKKSENINNNDENVELKDSLNLSSFLSSIFKSEVQQVFEPQVLLEKIRKDNKYSTNGTWEEQYHLLRCPAQSFLARTTLNGEFFDVR